MTDDPWDTPEHHALVAEIRDARVAGGGMARIFRRERAAGSGCIRLIVAAREAFGLSLMDAKSLSGHLEHESDERFDARLLWTCDPTRWPRPPSEDPLGLHHVWSAGGSVAACLRAGQAAGLGPGELAQVLEDVFALPRSVAAALVARLAESDDAGLDAALRDALARG